MGQLTGAGGREWAERTATAQGLAVKLTDPLVVRQLAVLLASGREPVATSELPVRTDAARVEGVQATGGGRDGDVMQKCGDDGSLS